MTSADNPKESYVYEPRTRAGFSEGYSIFVRVLKFVLPLIVLVIVGILIAHLSVDTQQAAVPEIKKSEKTIAGQVEVLKPKYEGVNEKGENYTITADRASRITDNGDGVSFENPIADIILDSGSWLALKAKSGSFDRKKEQLILKGNVTVFHDSGYELFFKYITISLRDKTASSIDPVRINGPIGRLNAKSFNVANNGDMITFTGPVFLKIFNFSSGVKIK